MKTVVQRVSRASVSVDGKVIGQIERGLLVFLGVGKNDTLTDADWMIKKLLNLRIFPDDADKMNRSVTDIGGGLLVVSQFTLYGDARKGTRPSFTDAMPPADAEKFYNDFMSKLRAATSLPIAEGKFAAMMEVELVNDGPVTIVLESVERASRPFKAVHLETNGRDARSTFIPFDPATPVSKHERNLPHWQQEGRTYFVTFRLADSLPQDKLRQWKAERAQWLRAHPKPWTDTQDAEYQKLFSERIDHWLDAGYGDCWLKDGRIATVVVKALRHFEGERYQLGSSVVMPNHVHALINPLAEWTIAQIVHSWKSFTSHEINHLLQRQGEVWQAEYFDHIVRNEDALARFEAYIQQNPSTAGLKQGEYVSGIT